METLSHNDILALNRAIGEIYAARDMESFYNSAFQSIQEIIPGELCSFNYVSPHPTHFLKVMASSQAHNNVASKLLPTFNAHINKHPLCPDFLSGNVFKTSDRASASQFKATAIYNEYYKHLNVETQMGFFTPVSQENAAGFALSRKGPDFSERDRAVLTLLKPHLIGALRNVGELGRVILERDLLQKGTEAERQGALLFQADGTVLCMSPLAKEMISRYIDAPLAEGDTLPEKLLRWFKAEANPPSPPFAKGGNFKSPPLKKGDSGGFSNRVEREPLTIEKDDRCLKIKLLNDFTTGDYILLMTERDDSVILLNLLFYGLSGRETEVLKLLSLGKTNAEIAVILGMSRRTVEKHLEHIFEKLGVETRAAAAAMIQN